MNRFLIRASDADQFRRARALVDGRARVFVTSERHLYLSTGDLPADLQDSVRATGATVAAERPAFRVRYTPDGAG